MPEKYLYDRIVEEFGKRTVAQIEIPNYVTDNLNHKFELRPYQVDAFQRFICYFENDFDFKQCPIHLLFNMATGSGKTLIMAGLILYLHKKGYRNFVFFVNSTNIIEKTKDNFLNPSSIKYLFNNDINIGNRRINISLVDNFEGVNPNDINICFTTIQKLHSDLTNEKENSITFEDFKKHKIVLIADEAHHINVKTKAQVEIFESWENTVERIFNQNLENLLLEFTATIDLSNPSIVEKYINKIIIQYDLLHFRNDRFSKDVVIIQSDFGHRERILQALILSQYKQEVAAKYRINLKPVILLKAQRTIDQSKENKIYFHKIIDELSAKHITKIRKTDIPVIQSAFKYFDDNGISDEQLAKRLKQEFHPDYCLSVNDENDKENHQILVNTLEDKNNRIRAIFAVQKLNEGWDVLNLFDIVRCYESRDTGRAKIGTTTLSEAQLIGRGARYFPFVLPQNNDKFRRKYDGDLDYELRVLEELHYHSINDNRYISEIKQALIEQGMMDEREVIKKLKLKDSFKKSDFYKKGVVWLNERQEKDYKRVRSFSDLGVKNRNYLHIISSGHGGATAALDKSKKDFVLKEENSKDLWVRDIDLNIVQCAISRNPFFTFATLKKCFPNLESVRDFIESKDYLGGLSITFQGNLYDLDNKRLEQLNAISGLLNQIESEISENVSDYEGTRNFKDNRVSKVFYDKILKFDAKNPRAIDDAQFEGLVSDKDWFAFNTIYGTSEEKDFVRMLARMIHELKEQYDQIYLLRNEGHFSIYNFSDGRAFQPDFVLFLKEKNKEMVVLQLFIEPKAKILQKAEQWKLEFLNAIKTEYETTILKLEGNKFRLIGVPFYNNEDENQFRDSLEAVLKNNQSK
ncbi:MAG: Type III restriction enzyme, res subunit [bacterium ADurb.Bin236]|mgnify:CR=1 FL=1|nr:MAG: Type III restriction enzyme, res subunit [bacterium ADurb.Bin236]